MKKIILIFSACLVFYSCKQESEKTATDTEIKKEVATIINNWHIAAKEANYNNYFNATDAVFYFIGTDASENWNKEAFSTYSKPFFDRGKAWTCTPLERNIYINKTKEVVWFDELLDTWMGICRGSGVLEKNKNQWKIKHYVLSLTIPNDNVREVLKINKAKDSLFLINLKNKKTTLQ